MTPDLAIDIFKSTMSFALLVVAPFLGIILVVGLITSLIQSVTSMQEPTLTFVPKLLVLGGAALLLSPWLLRTLMEFTATTITRMGTMAH